MSTQTTTRPAVPMPEMQTNLWGDAATREAIRETFDLLQFAVASEASRVREGKGDQALVRIARRVHNYTEALGKIVPTEGISYEMLEELRTGVLMGRAEAARCWVLVLGMDTALDRLCSTDHVAAAQRFLAILDA